MGTQLFMVPLCTDHERGVSWQELTLLALGVAVPSMRCGGKGDVQRVNGTAGQGEFSRAGSESMKLWVWQRRSPAHMGGETLEAPDHALL